MKTTKCKGAGIIKKKSKDRLLREARLIPGYIFVSLWVIAVFVIIGWIILASLSTTREIFKGELIASGLQWGNYKKALFSNKLIVNLMNSAIYTAPSCALIILVCAPAAYCMSRFSFLGNRSFQKLILTGLSIPSVMIIMPLCSVVGALNMSGSRFTMIFLYTATSVPYTTYFLMTFFKSISNTYVEAATIDGCGQVRCFWQIMFPLAQPALITVTIFNFITIWNEYFLALVFANKTELRSLGVGLYQIVYSMMNTGDWSGLFAAVVITFVPTVVIYIFLADKIISGVTAGGVKG